MHMPSYSRDVIGEAEGVLHHSGVVSFGTATDGSVHEQADAVLLATMSIGHLASLLEAYAGRPGVMSLAGVSAEHQMTKALKSYFSGLGIEIRQRIRGLAATHTDHEAARHEAEMHITQVVRSHSGRLKAILVEWQHRGLLAADKLPVTGFKEADNEEDPVDPLTAEDAANIAVENAAKSVTGIDETTTRLYADAVADSIKAEESVQQLSQRLRGISEDMQTSRSRTIAATEMADAFGEASLRKLERSGVEYKQIILSPSACEICIGIQAAGPVPVDDPFVDDEGEEYDRTPIHVNCRCATVGARAPEVAESLFCEYSDDEPRDDQGKWSSEGVTHTHIAGSNGNHMTTMKVGNKVAGTAISRVEGGNATIHKVQLKKEFRGKGLGNELYNRHFGELKNSGVKTVTSVKGTVGVRGDSRNTAASHVWSSMEKNKSLNITTSPNGNKTLHL